MNFSDRQELEEFKSAQWWSALKKLLDKEGITPGDELDWSGFYEHGYTPEETLAEYKQMPTD